MDSSLWTETPAERRQRVANEVAVERRAANADPDVGDESAELEARKRGLRDEETRKGVDDYAVCLRYAQRRRAFPPFYF